MASVSSITVGGLELHAAASDGIRHYAVGTDTLIGLRSSVPYSAVSVTMAGRPDVYVRRQPTSRTFPLNVFFLDQEAVDRQSYYDALVAVLDSDALVEITWTEAAVTYRYMVLATQTVPNAWYQRSSTQLTAFDPVAQIV
jgi:hypothetical protein